MRQKKDYRWLKAAIIIFSLSLVSLLFSSCVSDKTGNVAHITIAGAIQPYSDESIFGSTSLSSTDVVDLIDKANKDPTIKAILFEINSPGGMPVSSLEMMQAIKSVSKPTVCWIREVGASGAYWAASACDMIIASPISVVGSVGVLGSYIDFSGLMKMYNVTYQKFTGGKYKDIGSQFRNITPEEKKILQDTIDDMHKFFLDSVSTNRNLTYRQKEEISSGLFYLGNKAIELNLIDELGGKPQAIDYLKKQINETIKLSDYSSRSNILDIFKLSKNSDIKLGINEPLLRLG